MTKSHPLKFELEMDGEGLDRHYILRGLKVFAPHPSSGYPGKTSTVLKLKLGNNENEARLLREALELVQPDIIPSDCY